MNYLDVGRKLNIKDFRYFPKSIMFEWIKTIEMLIMKSFVKPIEVQIPENQKHFDVFLFIDGQNNFIIKQTEDSTKISFCYGSPIHFFQAIEESNCNLSDYSISLEYQDDDIEQVKFNTIALNQFIISLVRKKVISPTKGCLFLQELRKKSQDEAEYLNTELQLTFYYKHLFDVYTSGMNLPLTRKSHFFEDDEITMSKVSFGENSGVLLNIERYSELYILNDFNQLLVIPSIGEDFSLTYHNSTNFNYEDLLELKNIPFPQIIKPAGFFSVVVDFNKFPYILQSTNCDVFKAHQLLLAKTHKGILKSHEK